MRESRRMEREEGGSRKIKRKVGIGVGKEGGKRRMIVREGGKIGLKRKEDKRDGEKRR